MRSNYFYAILFLFMPVILLCQTENWIYRYNGPANSEDGAISVTYGGDGNIYAAGYSTGIGTGRDFTIISLGTLGIEETQSDTNNYRVHAIITSPNPCRNSTMIFSNRYVVNEYVELSLYDNLGRYIETIHSGITPIHLTSLDSRL